MASTAKRVRGANGEGGVRQRAGGRWEARAAIVDAAGRLHRRSVSADTERDAKRRLRELVAQHKAVRCDTVISDITNRRAGQGQRPPATSGALEAEATRTGAWNPSAKLGRTIVVTYDESKKGKALITRWGAIPRITKNASRPASNGQRYLLSHCTIAL